MMAEINIVQTAATDSVLAFASPDGGSWLLKDEPMGMDAR
jgi:hypothetical protein